MICIILLSPVMLVHDGVTAADIPIVQNQGQNKTTIGPGENITLHAQGSDDVALDWAWLSTDETGEWQEFKDWWNSDWKHCKKLIIDHIEKLVNKYDGQSSKVRRKSSYRLKF